MEDNMAVDTMLWLLVAGGIGFIAIGCLCTADRSER
jgi:hypothetical protein